MSLEVFNLQASVELKFAEARKGLDSLISQTEKLARALGSLNKMGFSPAKIIQATKNIGAANADVANQKKRLDQADFQRIFDRLKAGEKLSRSEKKIIAERVRLETAATQQEKNIYSKLEADKLANYRKTVTERQKLEDNSVKLSVSKQRARDKQRVADAKKNAAEVAKAYANSDAGIIDKERARQADKARKQKLYQDAGLAPQSKTNGAGAWLKGAAASFAGNLGAAAVTAAMNTLRMAISAVFTTFRDGITTSIRLSFEFENAIKQLQGVTKISGDALKTLSEDFRTIGDRLKIGVDPTEAVKGLKDLFALGYTSVPKAMKVLDQSLKLSKAGFIEQGKAAELLGTTMIAYGADASEASRFSDALIASTDLGAVTMEQLAQSMGRVTPFAVQSGTSIETLTALIGASTATGLRAESSITGMGQAFQKLTNPGAKAQEAMKGYGLTVNETTLKQKGLVESLKEIDRAVGGSSAAWNKILGGNTRAQVSIMSLFDPGEGEARYKRLDAAILAVANSAGLTQTRLDVIMQSASEQFLLFQSNVKAAAIGIGQQLEPAVGAFLTMLNGELKPELDAIAATLSVMMNEFLHLLGITSDADSLKQTLIDVNTTLIETSQAISYVVGVMKTIYNVFRMASNAVQMYLNFLSAFSGIMKDLLTGNWGNIDNQIAKLIANMKEDASDFSTAWGNMLNVDQEWEDSLARQERMLKTASGKFVKVAEVANNEIATQIAKGAGLMDAALLRKQQESDKKQLAKGGVPKGGVTDRLGKSTSKLTQATATSGTAGVLDLAGFLGGQVLSSGAQILNMFGKPGKPSAPPPVQPRDIGAEVESIGRREELGKIKKSDALSLYEGLLRATKQQETSADDVYKVEKAIFDLKKEQTAEIKKQRDDQAAAAKEKRKADEKVHLDFLEATKGETAAKLKALEYEMAERKRAGADPKEVQATFAAQSKMITAEGKEKDEKKAVDKVEKANKATEDTLKVKADIAGTDGNVLQERLLQLDAEFAKFEGIEKDKTLVTELYAKKRAKIEKDYLKEVEDARLALVATTKSNEIAALEAQGKSKEAEKLTMEQEYEMRYQEVKKTVEDARKAGVSEVDIRKYVASEQLRVVKEAAEEKKRIENPMAPAAGPGASPLMDPETAFAGMASFGTLGLTTGSEPAIDRKANNSAKKAASMAAAAKFGKLSDPASSGLAKMIGGATGGLAGQKADALGAFKNTLDINITAPGSPTQSVTASNSKPASANVGGRFA